MTCGGPGAPSSSPSQRTTASRSAATCAIPTATSSRSARSKPVEPVASILAERPESFTRGGFLMLPTTTDVLVVGAGPTGLTAAVSLVARGREVTIVDNQDEGQNTSRASVVYPRTLEVLEPYGVAQRLASQGIHAQRFTIRDRDRVLMNVPFDWLPTAYPYTLLVSQAVTESVLLRRLHQLGGRVLRPYTLTRLDQDGTGVTATFAGGQQLRAGYVVGADG